METYTLVVDHKTSDIRLDVFLSDVLTFCSSRSFAKRLIRQGHVFINGKRAPKAHYQTRQGDTIVVKLPEKTPCGIAPEPIALNIFYEDQSILIVHKPVGMVVHPGAGCHQGTLVNALVYHQKKLSKNDDPLRPGIVHRLDKETSGLMVIAKNNAVHDYLAKQFEKQRVYKQYIAIVQGVIAFDEGCVDAPMGRHPIHREKRTVAFAQSKQAFTVYRVLERFSKTTAVWLWPKTGRTHQLRVHMAHLGHPILGDAKYGKKNSFSRLALHAQSLGFQHPETSAYVEFFSPFPEEFLTYIHIQKPR